jgi:hypothetical protein
MAKFLVRAHKIVYYPENVEVEARTYEEAAKLGLAKIEKEDPNWIEAIHLQNVTDIEVWNESVTPPKKRNIAIGGREHAKYSR